MINFLVSNWPYFTIIATFVIFFIIYWLLYNRYLMRVLSKKSVLFKLPDIKYVFIISILITLCSLYIVSINASTEQKETFVKIDAAEGHFIGMTSTNRIYTWGRNDLGQLGDGSTIEKLTPVDITDNFSLESQEKIVKIIAGLNKNIALTSNGKVFIWGYGWPGYSLIAGPEKTPVDVTNKFNLNSDEKIIDMNLNNIITSKGRVFTWGHNSYGQLGDGTKIDQDTPVDITNNFDLELDETIISVASSSSHNIALSSNGRVFSWGYNRYGQLGDGSSPNSVEDITSPTPVEITENFHLQPGEKIIKVMVGSSHSVAISSKNRVFTWGKNYDHQLGNDKHDNQYLPIDITHNFHLGNEETIINIITGSTHNIAITSRGRLFAWGANENGQLADGTYGLDNLRGLPTDITENFNLHENEIIIYIKASYYNKSNNFAVTSKGRIFIWGSEDISIDRSLPREIILI